MPRDQPTRRFLEVAYEEKGATTWATQLKRWLRRWDLHERQAHEITPQQVYQAYITKTWKTDNLTESMQFYIQHIRSQPMEVFL